jgi:hypothetical protein
VKKRKRSGFTLDLGADLEAKLAAFVATYYVKTKHDVIRESLIAHMEAALGADRERLVRYQRNLAAGRSGARPRTRSPKDRTGPGEGL